jgi:DNA replication protein DnaC
MKPIKDTIEKMMAEQREEEKQWNALPEEEKQRIILEEEQKRRDDRISSYEAKGITPRYYNSEWENWIADTPMKKKVFDTVKKAWNTNLFLCGKSGTGKTHLAICLAKDGAVYRRLPDIFREVRTNLDSEQVIINRYGSVKLLIIDEVGRQKYSPFEKNFFFEIIDKRWNNILPTALITNLDEKEFSAEYGTAIVDRLRPIIVRFNWESHRAELNLPEKTEPENQEDDIDF